MKLLKQARFYSFISAELAETVTRDLSDMLLDLSEAANDDLLVEIDDDHSSFVFDYENTAERQIGFVPLYDGFCQSQTEEIVYGAKRGNWFFFQVLLREKKIDPSQLRKEVERQAAKEREQTGEPLSRRETRELTEQVKRSLLVKNATMKYKRALVAVNDTDSLLFINNPSPSFCEDVTGFLRSAVGSLPIQPYPNRDMLDNQEIRVVSAFEETETHLYGEDGYQLSIQEWLKAEQVEEGKVNMRFAPTEVLESLVANQYRPIKYEIRIKTDDEDKYFFRYEDYKLTQITTPELMDDMISEEAIDDPVAEYWAQTMLTAGTLDVLVEALKCLGSDIDEDGSLGF